MKRIARFLACGALLTAWLAMVIEANAQGVAKKKDKYIVGYAQSNLAETWRAAQVAQAREEAKKHPEIELVVSDAKADSLTQIANVKNFLVQKVDLLIVCPHEGEPLTPVVKQAYEGGTPVIILDRAVIGDSYTCFIGADNVEIGRMAGEFIAKKLNGRGNIVEIEGTLGAIPTRDRSKGMHDAIAKYPDLKVIVQQTGEYLRSPAQKVMQNALQANKEIDCIYAHNDEMILGARLAAEAVHRENEMILIGIDGQKEAIEAVRDGKITATYYYPTCGKESIEYAAKIFAGEQVPKKVPLKTIEITKEDAVELLPLGF